MPPQAVTAAAAMASAEAGSATSTGVKTAAPPSAAMEAATCRPLSSLMSAATT